MFKGMIHKMIGQPARLYGMETVPITRSHVKKLQVTEMKTGMRPHAKRPCEKRYHQGETWSFTERCRKAISRWFRPRKEEGPRLRRKKDYGDLFMYLLCHIYPGVPHQCAALFSLGSCITCMTKQTSISIHSVILQ